MLMREDLDGCKNSEVIPGECLTTQDMILDFDVHLTSATK